MPSLSLPKSSVSKSSLFLVLASSGRYTSVQNVCGISSIVMLVCSFHIHEEDCARPPPLSSHSFTDRNPFVLVNMSGAPVESTCSGRHCVCHAAPLGIRSETSDTPSADLSMHHRVGRFRLTRFLTSTGGRRTRTDPTSGVFPRMVLEPRTLWKPLTCRIFDGKRFEQLTSGLRERFRWGSWKLQSLCLW